MPLWAESRIHGDVYVRFGGRLSETYHRKVAWRRQPSLQVTQDKIDRDVDRLGEAIEGKFSLFGLDAAPSPIHKDITRRRVNPSWKQRAIVKQMMEG